MTKEKKAKKDIVEETPISEELLEKSIENKLISLYTLQQIDSQIDKIRIIRGELPLEVQDLEDEVAGLDTRIENFENDIAALNQNINDRKLAMQDSAVLIKKYEEQQMNVRNNREYDSLTKEIEFQGLEIQLSEKKIREFNQKLEELHADVELAKEKREEKVGDLSIKKGELQSIIEETEKEELEYTGKLKDIEEQIEDRLLIAYKRIRQSARNGLAVVQIERDACGGCFNKIPPQHQLDIRMHKKVIVCEYCGRILVDNQIAESFQI